MIRVIIDRKSKDVRRLLPLLRDLRTEAMKQPGYISGETMVNADNRSNIMVISNWDSIKDWKAWRKLKWRVDLEKKIEPLLNEPATATIWRHLSYRKNIGEG